MRAGASVSPLQDVHRAGRSWVPPLLRGVAWLVAAQVLGYSALRLAFLVAFRSTGGEVPTADVRCAMWLGARFDLRLALLVVLPLLLLGLRGWLRAGRRFAVRAWRAWLAGA